MLGYLHTATGTTTMSDPIATAFGPFGRIGVMDMDAPLALHVHHHLHIILKVTGSDTQFQVKGRLYPAAQSTAILINQWEPHAWSPLTDQGPTRFLTLYLEPDWLRNRGFCDAQDSFTQFFTSAIASRSNWANHIIDHLHDLILASTQSIHPMSIAEELSGLLVELVKALQKGTARASTPAGRRIAYDYRIRRAMQLLHQPNTPIQLDSIADQVGLSRPHFFDLFKKCTGVTPNRVSNAIRMERAIALLTQSTVPMADLAEDLYFATPGNFSRFFKSQIGINPNAFRRTMITDSFRA
jgi:AraC-like DNA-binding protein